MMKMELFKRINNQQGIALMMVMVLSAIALSIMAALVYMLTTGTQLSGGMKRFKTAVDAAQGGTGVVYNMISDRGGDLGLGVLNIEGGFTNTLAPCTVDKLNNPTEDWTGCDDSIIIDIANAASYDFSFELGVPPLQYRVYAKIVDTVEGNSGGVAGLKKTGVVATGTGEVSVRSVPYLYSIEIESRNTITGGPQERAKLSILYQF